MGFFSRFFGRKNQKSNDNISLVGKTAEEVTSVVNDNPVVIEPLTPVKEVDNTKEFNKTKKLLDTDFHSKVVIDNNPTVEITVNGTNGPRVYTKDFGTVEEANEFISTSTTKIINWINNGKSLYQSMSYLQMKRIS